MKNRLLIFAMVFLALFATVPARAGDEAPADGGGKRIAAALSLRMEGPEERIRIGQKVNATVENPTRLSRHGVTAKTNDRVVVTLTSKDTFTLLHSGSGRSFRFKIDGQGNVTPAP